MQTGDGGIDVVVAMSQINLPANAKRTFMSTVYIPDATTANITDYHWSPFPFELSGAALIVPSPSGAKLLIVRKADANGKDGASATKLEIWGPGQLLKEIFVAASVHGTIYADGWYVPLCLTPLMDDILLNVICRIKISRSNSTCRLFLVHLRRPLASIF